MNKNGNPINAHPLSINEAKILAKALQNYNILTILQNRYG
jgi:hypothetical protein